MRAKFKAWMAVGLMWLIGSLALPEVKAQLDVPLSSFPLTNSFPTNAELYLVIHPGTTNVRSVRISIPALIANLSTNGVGGGGGATNSYNLDAGQFGIFQVTNVSIKSDAPLTNPVVRGNKALLSAGLLNTNTGVNSVHVGGSNNWIKAGSQNVISGGGLNMIEGGHDQVIGGGWNNRIYGTTDSDSVVGIFSGEDSYITNGSKHAFIGGGRSNVIDAARYSTIAGGWQHFMKGSNGTIGGGWFNTNESHNSTIGGGYRNSIKITNNFSTDAQNNNVIPGGYDNMMFCVENSGILSGYRNNLISRDSANRTLGSWIGGGFNNLIDIGYYCIIGGGLNNKLSGSSGSPNFIFSGEENLIDGGGSSMNLILSGTKNRIGPAAQHSVIVMGQNSTNAGGHSFIAAGQANWIKQGNGNFIIGSGLYVGVEEIDVFNIIDAAEYAILIGTAITNTTSSSVEIGVHDLVKSRHDASGVIFRGRVRQDGATSGSTERRLPAAGQTNLFIEHIVNPAAGQVRTFHLVGAAGPTNLITETNRAIRMTNGMIGDINPSSVPQDNYIPKYDAATGLFNWEADDTGGGGADADAIHDNVTGEIAAITDKATPVVGDHLLIEDSAASNAKKDITIGSLEAALEGVMDLQDFQGAVTDAQVPNTITVDVATLATTATTANAGDSATAFFSSGTLEDARLPATLVDGPGSSTDNAVPRWNGTTGILLKGSDVIINNTNGVSIPGGVAAHELLGTNGVGSLGNGANGGVLYVKASNSVQEITFQAPHQLAGNQHYYFYSNALANTSVGVPVFTNVSGSNMHMGIRLMSGTGHILASNAPTANNATLNGTTATEALQALTLVVDDSISAGGQIDGGGLNITGAATNGTLRVNGVASVSGLLSVDSGRFTNALRVDSTLTVSGQASVHSGVVTNRLTAGSVHVTSNITQTVLTHLVATNAAAVSNLTINVIPGQPTTFYLTNNVTLTNFAGLTADTETTVTLWFLPQLVNRTITLPTLGAPGYGVYWRTNAHNPIWTTYTNGTMVALSLVFRGTNIVASNTEWK